VISLLTVTTGLTTVDMIVINSLSTIAFPRSIGHGMVTITSGRIVTGCSRVGGFGVFPQVFPQFVKEGHGRGF